ncbi:MAG: SCO family protein [Planctomycetes bacterium]|nr:SCO family protein [Planctomycetota bacterium]
MVRTLIPACLGVLLLGTVPLRGEPALPPVLQKVNFEQKLNAQVPLDLLFQDETGQSVRLGEYFDHKPVILVLAYFKCPMLCTEVLNGLVQAMLALPFNAGREFTVLTVSFDPRENPPMAAAKKKNYLLRYGRPGAEEGWHFLTGDKEAIDKLTDAVGFRYTYDPKYDQFAHPSGIMVLTPRGKISRYFYDIHYNPRDLRLGLVEASENKIGSPVDRIILLYCFHYDPIEGKYGPVIINILRLSGAVTVLVLAIFLGVMWRKEILFWFRQRRWEPPKVTTGG